MSSSIVRAFSLVLAWAMTPIFLILTVLTLLSWHPVIVLTRYLHTGFHRWFVALGNGLLLVHLKLLGTRVCARNLELLPASGPLIVISNHQSFYDIPLLIWYLRRLTPLFIAKKELGHGFPSASYVLRTGGSALIDRGDARQALAEIGRCGLQALAERRAVAIFPEGTRGRDGAMRKFKVGGVQALCQALPGAQIAIIAINGSWRITRYNLLPVPIGSRVVLEVLAVVDVGARTPEELTEFAREEITAALA